MIKAIIIDDEEHCITRLQNLADSYCKNDLQIVGAATSVEEGMEQIDRCKPDLVFLDIQINRDTGFDLLANFSSIPFQLIFTTAYEQYAIKAFRFSALDYLLKPIDPDELQTAVIKVKSQLHERSMSKNLESLVYNIKNLQHQHKIAIPTISGLEFIAVQDIVHCKSDINYTTIFMKDGSRMVVAKTLKEFEEMLVSHQFYRVHNSHLVNMNRIKSYHKGKGGWLQMEDGTEIEVSTRRKEDFLHRLATMN